ncbi:MAG: type II toxin-antitoxin system MqsA family antitoxin [Bacteroidetes bacterium]|nr:type II toxin-antitoxin system MqsA family antitoxin [Bacteroidota bacterium]
MTCTDCKHGIPVPGKTTVSYDKDDTTIVIREVPALICPVCQAYYLDLDTADRVTRMVSEAVQNGAVVEVIKMRAA